MGGSCNCNCEDGEHELYQEMVMAQKSPQQRAQYGTNTAGYNPNLKPLQRKRTGNLNDEHIFEGQDQQF